MHKFYIYVHKKYMNPCFDIYALCTALAPKLPRLAAAGGQVSPAGAVWTSSAPLRRQVADCVV